MAEVKDAIIVGSGPAAYSCAVRLKGLCTTQLIEGGYIGGNGPGGQLTTTTLVDNYPGFPEGISGPDLVALMAEHAGIHTISETAASVSILQNESGTEGPIFEIRTEKNAYRARCVVIATGAAAKRLNVPGTGENEFWMRGISACAVCDGWAYRDKVCCVIGGGDSAMEETKYLAGIARFVYLVHRREKFRARADMVGKVERLGNVKILKNYVLVRAEGTNLLERVVLKCTVDESEKILDVDGLFFGIGHVPNSALVKGVVDLDEDGYVITTPQMETSVPGIFACGDVQDKKIRQANTAAASGCVAALSALKYLNKPR
eukprot:jgi/Antlo1/1496/536